MRGAFGGITVVAILLGGITPETFAAGPLPGGGKFVAGAGSIVDGSNRVDITQSSARGVIDWNSFSIGAGNTVNVNNGSGATLSRVTGAGRSLIDGTLTATGSLYLVNPQGVVIGKDGVVTTGGRFAASALDLANDAFMAGGDQTFSGGGSGSVINLGKISSTGGDVFLISRTLVRNDGAISAPAGSVELAAGDSVLVRDSSSAPQTYVQAASHGDVYNSGDIAATQIALQAADGNVYALAGNHTALRATGTATRDGHVWLVAPKGTAHIHTSVYAANADGSGGTVDSTGAAFHLDDADIHAAQWNLDAPVFNVGPATTAVLLKQLNQGTSVALNATLGDIVLETTLRWTGDASLNATAARSVTVGPMATLGNAGAGNLGLRADASGIDNGGGVSNRGTIDWSKSTGTVAALYDMNGVWTPGTIRTNTDWQAAPYSGLKTQFTAYKLVNSQDDLQKIGQDLAGKYALGVDLSNGSGAVSAPIGAGSARGFTGQFDGFGHTLDGFVWSSVAGEDTATPTGLFSTIGAAGVVRNLAITNASLTAYFGPLGMVAGTSAGLIANVTASGTATGYAGTGPFGGLVGDNSGTISRTSFKGTMNGYASFGGLVGLNTGTVEQSAVVGVLTGYFSTRTGGLVYDNRGLIRESRVDALAIGETAGGLANTNSGTIEQSYSVSEISPRDSGGNSASGSVAGVNTGTIANDVYWAVDAPGGSANWGVGTGQAPPSANGFVNEQMTNPASFASTWNFAPGGTWFVQPGLFGPLLQWEVTQ
jgi:filamentous hemagglutinin family protein